MRLDNQEMEQIRKYNESKMDFAARKDMDQQF